MARFLKKRHQSRGKSPGSLIFIGTRKMDATRIRVMDYDGQTIHSDGVHTGVMEFARLKQRPSVTWIDVAGLHDTRLIGEIGRQFDIHPLVLEDILNTGQRPKLDEFDLYNFITLKMIQYQTDDNQIHAEQLSLVFGQGYVLTFQEQPNDVFDPVRERIKRDRSRIRGAGADYLAYALMDAVVDHYISAIEMFGEQIESLELKILSGEDDTVMEKILGFKQDASFLRKAIRPAGEAVSKLSRMDNSLIQDHTLLFVKDLQDHISHASDAVDTYRDLLTDQLNVYNSVMANKMNDIMKTLTIFAAVFIPLTFVAGIYGTNFEYLPELRYKYSYFVFWAVLVAMAGGLLYYFKRKKWL